MFGHQNDVITQDQHADASVPLPESTINALTSAPATTSETDSPAPTASAPAIDDTIIDETPSPAPEPSAPAPNNSIDGVTAPGASQPAPAAPYPTYTPAPTIVTPNPLDQIEAEEPKAEPTNENDATDASEPEEHISSPVTPEELLKIKQEALQSLSPLVGKLDVGPEEKFRTLMMLIQASDDHNQLTEAYEVAKTITNEKARAQALLDVVNEINYFTSKSK